jgi:hypothetical protein
MQRQAQLTGRRRNENLGRRIETLLIKAHELWTMFGVDAAVILKNNTRYHTYRSTDKPTWPPTMAEIVCDTSYYQEVTSNTRQEATYPLPQNLHPRDLEAKAAKRRAVVQRGKTS